ncbi:hypothetical protein [Microcoleus sp. herbarium12]|uniref:hypothetical protein n=1 Tax=Microcoleus sp. herbarium12 TaxID=3055437 RepID=UPI002FD38B13
MQTARHKGLPVSIENYFDRAIALLPVTLNSSLISCLQLGSIWVRARSLALKKSTCKSSNVRR